MRKTKREMNEQQQQQQQQQNKSASKRGSLTLSPGTHIGQLDFANNSDCRQQDDDQGRQNPSPSAGVTLRPRIPCLITVRRPAASTERRGRVWNVIKRRHPLHASHVVISALGRCGVAVVGLWGCGPPRPWKPSGS